MQTSDKRICFRVSLAAVVAVMACDLAENVEPRVGALDEDFDAEEEELHDTDLVAEVVEAGSATESSPAGATDLPVSAMPEPQAGGGSPSCEVFPSAALATASCRWETVATSGSGHTTARADCDNVGAGYAAITGGCWTNTAGELTFSFPDEAPNDMPDDGDDWENANFDGWSCGYSTMTTVSTWHRAGVLCCLGTIFATCG